MVTKDELKKMDIVTLKNEAESLKKELFNLKFGLMTGQMKDMSQFMKLRRQIARILTEARQKRNVEQQPSKRKNAIK